MAKAIQRTDKTTRNRKTVTIRPKQKYKKPDTAKETDTVRRCLYCGRPL